MNFLVFFQVAPGLRPIIAEPTGKRPLPRVHPLVKEKILVMTTTIATPRVGAHKWFFPRVRALVRREPPRVGRAVSTHVADKGFDSRVRARVLAKACGVCRTVVTLVARKQKFGQMGLLVSAQTTLGVRAMLALVASKGSHSQMHETMTMHVGVGGAAEGAYVAGKRFLPRVRSYMNGQRAAGSCVIVASRMGTGEWSLACMLQQGRKRSRKIS